jgi:NADH:ubiquinone oxidoreductase subunit D
MLPYEIYSKCFFNIPVGLKGDCFDRYLIRIEEMRNSIFLVEQCLNNIPKGPVKILNYKYSNPERA